MAYGVRLEEYRRNAVNQKDDRMRPAVCPDIEHQPGRALELNQSRVGLFDFCIVAQNRHRGIPVQPRKLPAQRYPYVLPAKCQPLFAFCKGAVIPTKYFRKTTVHPSLAIEREGIVEEVENPPREFPGGHVLNKAFRGSG